MIRLFFSNSNVASFYISLPGTISPAGIPVKNRKSQASAAEQRKQK